MEAKINCYKCSRIMDEIVESKCNAIHLVCPDCEVSFCTYLSIYTKLGSVKQKPDENSPTMPVLGSERAVVERSLKKGVIP